MGGFQNQRSIFLPYSLSYRTNQPQRKQKGETKKDQRSRDTLHKNDREKKIYKLKSYGWDKVNKTGNLTKEEESANTSLKVQKMKASIYCYIKQKLTFTL